MPQFNLFVTFDGSFNKEVQKDYNIAGQDLTDYLVKELKKRGFVIKSAENIEFAFEVKCLSGTIEYEITIGLDQIYNKYWEIWLKPKYSFLEKLIGKKEDEEIGNLLNAINNILRSDANISDIRWYRQYGDPDSVKKKSYSVYPVED